MSIPVLYFHGFASSPASAKVVALRALLEPEIELITPDLNVPSFEKLDLPSIIALGVKVGRERKPRAIVGSSLGSIIALEVARAGIDAPLVLIAPALGIAQRWREKIPAGDPVPMFNFARNTEVPIHRRFFDQIFEVDVDQEPPRRRVVAIMGRDDQSVPFEIVEETWQKWEGSGRLAPGSRFIPIEGGDHSLVSEATRIADEIRGAVESD